MREDIPPTTSSEELLTDREGKTLAKVGMTSWFELQKQPDFPPPIWLGPRLKRHRKTALLAWLLTKQGKRPEAA